MAIYAVHCPAGQSDAATAERARFVRLGFSWGAFVFGPLWLLVHRLWRPLGVAILGAALVGLAAARGLIRAEGAFWLYVAYAFYLGFEGRAFLSAALGRRGKPLADIVCAPDLSGAELSFFTKGPRTPPPPRPSTTLSTPPGPPPPQVLGLFPEAGR